MKQIIEKRKIWLTISSVAVGLSFVFLLLWGLNLGIDFTGGSLLEVKFNQERPELQELKDVMNEANLEGDVIIQPAGVQNMIIRFQDISEETHQSIFALLEERYPENIQEERFESIGPSIGQELKSKAVYSMILVILAIVLYVGYAFRKVSYPVKSWKYGIIAIIALVHDIMITLGVFAQ